MTWDFQLWWALTNCKASINTPREILIWLDIGPPTSRSLKFTVIQGVINQLFRQNLKIKSVLTTPTRQADYSHVAILSIWSTRKYLLGNLQRPGRLISNLVSLSIWFALRYLLGNSILTRQLREIWMNPIQLWEYLPQFHPDDKHVAKRKHAHHSYRTDDHSQ